MQFIPMLCYYFRWNMIEMLVNLINIAYRSESAQEFRFVLSEQIRQQIFYVSLLQKIETNIKSSVLMKALKRWIHQQCFHLYKL